MKTVIAFGASISTTSINKTLASSVVRKLENINPVVVNLNDYGLPIYSADIEKENGIPQNAHKFNALIESADGIVISLAEHNGNFSAAFKNLFDWLSRMGRKVWKDKPIFLMATSPGGRGGASVLNIAKNSFPYFGGNIIADFSLPSFFENFENGEIKDPELRKQLEEKIVLFSEKLS